MVALLGSPSGYTALVIKPRNMALDNIYTGSENNPESHSGDYQVLLNLLHEWPNYAVVAQRSTPTLGHFY